MNTTHDELQHEHCRPDVKALPATAIVDMLRAMPDWVRNGDAIARRFKFTDFHQTMAFVNAVAAIAHREDHHPDLQVGYDHCGVAWSTHSAGGLTRNDFICAARVDVLAGH